MFSVYFQTWSAIWKTKFWKTPAMLLCKQPQSIAYDIHTRITQNQINATLQPSNGSQ